jgi:hypothetical protein
MDRGRLFANGEAKRRRLRVLLNWSCYENAKEKRSAIQAVCYLWPAVSMAQKMGKGLGGSEVLL